METVASDTIRRRAEAYRQWVNQRANDHIYPRETPDEAARIFKATVEALEASLAEEHELANRYCKVPSEIVFFIKEKFKKIAANEYDPSLAMLSALRYFQYI